MYAVELTPEAAKDMIRLKKNEPAAYEKAKALLNELALHPYTGTGRPKLLRNEFAGYYSRRISLKHRLIYKVIENKILVVVISASGHYNDK